MTEGQARLLLEVLERIAGSLQRIADAFQQKPKEPQMHPRVEEAHD